MIYWFHACVCVSLIVLQTSVIPQFLPFGQCYDLLIPFVLWLGMYRLVLESVIVILIIGCLMDSLSYGPFGLYCTAYIWLFIGIKWGRNFLHVEKHMILPLVSAMAVVMENCLFLISIFFLADNLKIPEYAFQVILEHAVWALFTGSFLIAVFEAGYNAWLTQLKNTASKGAKNRD